MRLVKKAWRNEEERNECMRAFFAKKRRIVLSKNFQCFITKLFILYFLVLNEWTQLVRRNESRSEALCWQFKFHRQFPIAVQGKNEFVGDVCWLHFNGMNPFRLFPPLNIIQFFFPLIHLCILKICLLPRNSKNSVIHHLQVASSIQTHLRLYCYEFSWKKHGSWKINGFL